MREKGEREAPHRSSGAIRLTEFDPERRDGYVNRLTKETTSFFFSNFPEETQVMELWGLFAKHGRVGEVYVPKKRDKRGNRFGFVKFKEVKSIEALSGRLEDVWIGTFKLKVNLSLFDRNGKRDPTSQRKVSGVSGKNSAETSASDGGNRANAEKPFMAALMGPPKAGGKNALPSLEIEVATNMMGVLQGSYVGRLGKGVEFRALQVKLWLAGLHSVRVASMGGGLVLLFRNSGENVGEPACKKDWWGGLLTDVKIWSPNQVAKTLEVWVGMYGIPPHAWGESTFRKLASYCGTFLESDVEARNRVRLDVARVKVEIPLSCRIDLLVNIFIQGAKFVVRMVEEGGGLMREEGYIEDQLRRSEVGSSCASGGKASVRAVLGGLDDAVSDSDGSEHCQQEVEEVGRSNGYKQGFGATFEKTGGVPGVELHIPSTSEKVMGIDDNSDLVVQNVVRGSDAGGHVEAEKHGVELEGHVITLAGSRSTELVNDSRPGHVAFNTGPGHVEAVLGPKNIYGAVEAVSGGAVDRGILVGTKDNSVIAPTQPSTSKGVSPKKKMIDQLDQLITETRDKAGVVSTSILSEGSIIPSTDLFQSHQKHTKVCRVPTTMPPLFGPKCLRFAGVINNSAPIRRSRKLTASTASSFESHIISSEDVSSKASLEVTSCFEVGGGNQESGIVQHSNPQGLELSVCLPFPANFEPESGVRHLLNEDTIKDVDGFVAARESPLIMEAEANQLLMNQKGLGFNFVQSEVVPVDRMVNMEIRDREKLSLDQESNGIQ
jgi:hypothetical protein